LRIIAKDIEVIAYFKKNGNLEPLKFRVEEDNKYKIIKIDRIVEQKYERFCGNKMLVFTCISLINSIEKIFEIKYDIENCNWILYKI
jgi:hypothetical protein